MKYPLFLGKSRFVYGVPMVSYDVLWFSHCFPQVSHGFHQGHPVYPKAHAALGGASVPCAASAKHATAGASRGQAALHGALSMASGIYPLVNIAMENH